MKSEEDLLRALADHDRELEAGAEVETRVLFEFRRRRKRRSLALTGWFLCAAAALIAGFFIERGRIVPPVEQIVEQVQSPVVAAPEPSVVAAVPVHKVQRARPAAPREIVTEFFPLTDVAIPFERGELLRVTLPASAMRSVGLPVNEDRLNERVQADVLVGEEGRARAIRFVRFDQ